MNSSCALEAKRDSSFSGSSNSGASSHLSPVSLQLQPGTLFQDNPPHQDQSDDHLTPKLSYRDAFGALERGTSEAKRLRRLTGSGAPTLHQDAVAVAVDELHFKSPPPPPPAAHIAAVYEQPHLQTKQQRRQTQPIRMPSTFQQQQRLTKSTFKPNSFLLSNQQPAPVLALAQALPQQPNRRPRHSAARNSLESIQSRSSASSSAGAVTSSSEVADPTRIAGGKCPPSSSSVVVATRYVKPPQVPASPSTTRAEWQSVPLTELDKLDFEPQKPPRSLRRPSLATKMFNKLKGGSRPVSEPSSKRKYQLDDQTPGGVKSPASVGGQFEAQHQQNYTSKSSPPEQRQRQSIDGNGQFAPRAGLNGKPSPHGGLIKEVAVPRQQIGKRKPPFLFAGILASILGSIFFSLGMLTIKLLPDGHGLAEKTKIVCFRGVMIMCLCSVTIVKQKSTFLIRRDELLVNVLRSVLGFMGVYMAYVSLKYISMGDSTALVFSSPVWTSLLSHFILNEPLRWIQLLALPLSILGIVLIAHPSLLIDMEHEAGATEKQPLIDLVDVLNPDGGGESGGNSSSPLGANENLTLQSPGLVSNAALNQTIASLTAANSSSSSGKMLEELNQDLDIAMNTHEQFDYEHRWKGIVISIACSFVVSFVYIVLKFRKTTPIQTTTFWLGFTTFAGALTIGAFVGFGELPSRWTEWALLFFNGICSWLGQCLLQWGLAYEDASVLSVVRTLDVAMTFSLSALFLEEEILWTSVLGASIIALVVVSIMLSNYISDRFCSGGAQGSGAGTGAGAGSQTQSERPSVSLSSGDASGLDGTTQTSEDLAASRVQFRDPAEVDATHKSLAQQLQEPLNKRPVGTVGA